MSTSVGRRFLAASAVVVALSLLPALAFGFANEGDGSRTTCVSCHGATATPPSDSNADTTTVTGPHRGYTATSAKCATCHQVHAAAAPKLLPTTTVSDTCRICHDGTGGFGVYGVILARTGLPPAADHSYDQTRAIPGGDATTGGTRIGVFSTEEPTRNMTCTDCHTPHGGKVVADFTGDRKRTANDLAYPIVSSRLLKKRPGNIGYDINNYGSDWCGACHQGRVVQTPVHNHPVATDTVGFYYENVIRMASDNSGAATQNGSIGASNRAFLMTAPTVAALRAQEAGPICQQCHEDARNVGILAADGVTADPEAFTVTSLDGDPPAGQNPVYQVFPHESQNPRFLVEQDDDLCTNCHATGVLP